MVGTLIRGGVVAAAVLALVLTCAGPASAARDERGGVRVLSNAEIAPRELPRIGRAPVGVRLESTFRSVDGAQLPRLHAMRFAINREGRLNHRGIPRCRKARIENALIETALAACRQALVGRGTALIRVAVPGQRPFPLDSRAFLFNAPGPGGRPRILLYMSSHQPFSPFIVPVAVRRGPGPFGTTLTAKIPADTVGVYVERFNFALRRRYLRRGTQRSYLSAGCPAPSGLQGLIFPLVRSTFLFEGGLRLTTENLQTCRVRDRGT